MNTHDIEAFIAVVETGSISAAAARLNLTQPGITRRVQNLEASVGAGLLDRMSKPLKPTSAGREAYELGRRVLRSVDDLMVQASRLRPIIRTRKKATMLASTTATMPPADAPPTSNCSSAWA